MRPARYVIRLGLLFRWRWTIGDRSGEQSGEQSTTERAVTRETDSSGAGGKASKDRGEQEKNGKADR